MNTRFKTLSIAVVFNLFFIAGLFAQTYSSDLDDCDHLVNKLTPIGDLGNIDSILDLRGFFPFAADSKSKEKSQTSGIFNFFSTDIVQWYKFPTMSGVLRIYYGDINDDSIAKVKNTKIITEDKLEGDDKQWGKFAYGLVSAYGKELFTSINGTSFGFDNAEPVNILLTQNSAVVIMCFKYSDIDRKGTGQILCAYEFSRTLKEYKNFYEIYSTTMFSRSAKKTFGESEPYLIKAISVYLTGQ